MKDANVSKIFSCTYFEATLWQFFQCFWEQQNIDVIKFFISETNAVTIYYLSNIANFDARCAQKNVPKTFFNLLNFILH